MAAFDYYKNNNHIRICKHSVSPLKADSPNGAFPFPHISIPRRGGLIVNEAWAGDMRG